MKLSLKKSNVELSEKMRVTICGLETTGKELNGQSGVVEKKDGEHVLVRVRATERPTFPCDPTSPFPAALRFDSTPVASCASRPQRCASPCPRGGSSSLA